MKPLSHSKDLKKLKKLDLTVFVFISVLLFSSLLAFEVESAKKVLSEMPSKSSKNIVKDEVMTIEKKVEVVAKLQGFMENGIYDDFEDGTSVSYDLSVLIIIEPKKYKGHELQVQHNLTPPPDSKWREVGHILKLRLDADLISKANAAAWTDAIEVVSEDRGGDN